MNVCTSRCLGVKNPPATFKSCSNGGRSLKSNVKKENNTSVIFFKLFHLRKRQKGEKIYTQETVSQQVSILKMFSQRDSLLSVFLNCVPKTGKVPQGSLQGWGTEKSQLQGLWPLFRYKALCFSPIYVTRFPAGVFLFKRKVPFFGKKRNFL